MYVCKRFAAPAEAQSGHYKVEGLGWMGGSNNEDLRALRGSCGVPWRTSLRCFGMFFGSLGYPWCAKWANS